MNLTIYHKDLKSVLNEEIAGRFWNYSGYEYPLSMETPFDIFNKMLSCPQTKSSPLIAMPDGPGSLKNSQHLTMETKHSVIELTRKFFAVVRGKRETADRENASQTGTKCVLNHFPAFNRHFPGREIAVGKGSGLCLVSPVRVEFKGLKPNEFSVGDELTCTFAIHFRDGLRGQVGYMDRIKPNREFSRWHIYPCGDVISADLYQDHRLKHDMFRTLMGHILLGEISPESYS